MAELLTLPSLSPEVVAAVSRWRGVFRGSSARRVALFVEDRLSFTGALLAAWAEGRQVVLPGDTLPATVAALGPHVDAFAGEFFGALQPSAVRGGRSSAGGEASFLAAVGEQALLGDDPRDAGSRDTGPRDAGSRDAGSRDAGPLDAGPLDAGPLEAGPLDAGPLEVPLPSLDREAEALVVFTSGSTGAPLAIGKKLRQLFDEVKALEACFGAQVPADAAVVTTVSHQHIYGLLFSVLWPLATGRTLTARRYEFFEELEAALAARDSVLVTSPAHLKRLPDSAAWTTKVRAVFSSGGPLPADAGASAKRVLGLAPLEVYGSSETGGIAWRTFERPRWTPLPGVEWRLTDDATLEVRSAHLPSSEWYRTADRAQADGEGFLLHGRADRIAKVEEKRVSLDAVERELLATGLLAEARVLVLDEHRVELAAVAVPSEAGLSLLGKGKRELTEALRERLHGVVERVALPRRFRFVDRLSVNPQGKVTQASLALLFAPERPAATWVEKGPTRAVLECPISPALRCLDGHFPETPLVPGVAQLDWALSFGREVFPLPHEVARLDVLKFQAILRPGMVAKLELDWNAEKHTLTFRFSNEAAVFSSGRFVHR